MKTQTSVRRPHKSIVVYAGQADPGEKYANAVRSHLRSIGVDATCLGCEPDARRIAAAVARQGADTVELCLPRGRGVPLLRELLQALTETGRRDARIVIHRCD